MRILRRQGDEPSIHGEPMLVSPADWRRAPVRRTFGLLQWLLLILLAICCVGPILWLARSAVTPTQETLTQPMALVRNGWAWSNLSEAWSTVQVGLYFRNTVVLAIGSWIVQLVVATTGGYALSVLRPRYSGVLTTLLLITLFVPAVVLLVPLYIEIVHPPLISHSFIDSYWAIWLPAGASAFNVVIVKRFFDNLPREIFEAAKVDGAGPFRLFWSIVLPMSKPILGVVSVFAVLASWRDFLWPLLVITDPDRQPLAVRLPQIQNQTELGVFLAALLIATLVPFVAFLLFQRSFLRGAGLGGAIKG
jgi:multiple sugar transport system permease protein